MERHQRLSSSSFRRSAFRQCRSNDRLFVQLFFPRFETFQHHFSERTRSIFSFPCQPFFALFRSSPGLSLTPLLPSSTPFSLSSRLFSIPIGSVFRRVHRSQPDYPLTRTSAARIISIVRAAIIHGAKKIIKCLWIMERNTIWSGSKGASLYPGSVGGGFTRRGTTNAKANNAAEPPSKTERWTPLYPRICLFQHAAL